MAKRNESILDILAVAPWWISISAAAVIYIASHFIIPSLKFENLIYQGLTKSSPNIGNMFSLVFVVGAVLSAFNSFIKARRLDAQTGIESIRSLSWKAFEELVGEAYRRQGYTLMENRDSGPDGGIDLVLKKDNLTTLVQCKHWKSSKVGVKIVRELFGVMTHQNAQKGIVITSGEFTREARNFAQANPIELINGEQLLGLIGDVQKEPKVSRPAQNTCPKCGAEMVLRTAKQGQYAGQKFWGCSNYPKCRMIKNI